LPQESELVPPRHWSPTQQPVQFVASQRCVLQTRMRGSHARRCMAQFTHVSPPCPHATASLPERHRGRPPSLLQQPVGHVVASQVCTLRPQLFLLASQNSKPVAMQSVQRPPPAPQFRPSVPTRHTLLESQHPLGQVVALHTPACGPPSSSSISRLERPHPGARKTKSTATAKAEPM
jgi:hypothetical protein